MESNTYTDDEFKKVLKNLFSEKKRVKDLEKQLEEKGLQKRFQAKLTDLHQHSVADEYSKLKSAYLQQASENEALKEQIIKVRPALKKLMSDLKNATSEIEILKSQAKTEESEQLTFAFQEANLALELMQKSNHALLRKLAEMEKEVDELKQEHKHTHNHAHKLEEECESLREVSKGHTATQQALEQQIRSLEQNLQAAQEALIEARSQDVTLTQHLELERGKLIERLAEAVAQLQRQAEQLSQQREENTQLRTELESTQRQLQGSDFMTLRSEYESQMQEALRSFSQKEIAHEESLERCYIKMREMAQRHAELVEEREMLYKKGEGHQKFLAKFEKEHSLLQTSLKNTQLQYEEMEAELIQTGQLLAKKVKETTLLGDLVESQKNQIMELQALNAQLVHSGTQAIENLTKEWQNKYFALQAEMEEQKGQLIELQKLRTTYEQMASTFSNLKTILGSTLEPPPFENPQDSGN